MEYSKYHDNLEQPRIGEVTPRLGWPLAASTGMMARLSHCTQLPRHRRKPGEYIQTPCTYVA